MNINTNTLLNMLNPGLANVISQKIDDASIDGKVNLGNVAQDKTIQSLLNGLFKDIASGAQNKQQVLNLLQNSEQSLSFKNLSTDIKGLLTTIQSNSNLSSNLAQQVSALQNSLLDLGKVDFNSLKTSLNNSGVFLESKLLAQNTPLTKNLSATVQNLTNLLNTIVSKGNITEPNPALIQKQISTILTQQNLTDEMVNSTKNMANTLLKDISLLQNSLKSEPQSMQSVQKILSSLEGILKNVGLNPSPNSEANANLKMDPQGTQKTDLVTNLKTLFHVNQTLPNTTNVKELVQTHLQQIRIAPDIPHDIKLEVKNAVETLLRQANMFQEHQIPVNKNMRVDVEQNISKLQQTLESLKLPTNIKEETVSGLKQIFQTLDTSKLQVPQTQMVQNSLTQVMMNNNVPDDIKLEVKTAVENLLRQANLPTASKQVSFQQALTQSIKSGVESLEQNLLQQGFKTDTTTQIKGMLLNSFDQVNIKTELSNLRTTLLVLHSSIEEGVSDVEQKATLKEQVQNLLVQHKSVVATKNIAEQLPQLNQLLQNMKGFEHKLDSFLANVQQQKMIPKEIASDLKVVVSQIQEQVEKSNEPVAKELRALVDRISSQIDYFQLLSYTSNSSHTYLSFLQDTIEDADIKFHKSDDDTFSCQINLSLKEQGDVKILLLLDKEVNLGVTIGVDNNNFKEKISNNLQTLRQGLNKAGLLLQSLNIFELDENKSQMNKVNSYHGDSHASFGLDLKA